jgi:hypothetical protein
MFVVKWNINKLAKIRGIYEMTEEDSNLTLCIHCSKPIAKDSVFCSYCGKEQKRPEEKLPGQIKLFFLNLLCPGAGDWCLGAKWRATFIFLVVIGSLVAYCLDIIPIVQKAVNDAVLRNNFKALNKLNESVSNNGWMYLFTIAYIFSFVDSIFLRINKQKLLDEDQK